MKLLISTVVLLGLFAPSMPRAEIVSSSPAHYVLRIEATSSLSAAKLWQRLIQPSTWWHPDHTYSGSSENLSLVAKAGGVWREDWEGGSVIHGTVILVKEGELLRMDAPFGPLQGLAAHTIWTINITSDGDGSKVVFDEVSNGPPTADLAELAQAVHYVKQEAINRLVAQ